MFLTRRSKADRFKLDQEPQSNEAFLERCGFVYGSRRAELALSVRRVIGECGSVEPGFIHDDHRWPEDLGSLAFYDSIDFLHFAFSVERATGRKLHPNAELHKYFYSGFTVSELVRRVVEILEISELV